MVIKKVKSGRTKNKEQVATTPDLEEKRKKFQQAAATKKAAHVSRKTQPKHHSSRKRTLIILVGALLAVIGSVTVAYGFFFWQQSPQKIVADAFMNAAASQEVSYEIEVNSPTMSLAAINGSYKNGASQASAVVRTSLPGKLATINGSIIATDNDLYLKVSHASDLVGEIAPISQKKVINALLPLVQKDIDDKWLLIAAKDASLFQNITKTSSCTIESIRMLSTNQQARSAFMQTYLQHDFFTVKEVKMDGNSGTYQLTIDKDTFHAFLDAITTSKPALPFSTCNKELLAVKSTSVDTSVVELVIDKTTRTITQATVSTSGMNATTVMVAPTFNQSSTIDVPENVTRFDAIKAQFLTLFSLTIGE